MLEERIKRQSKTRPPPASVAAPPPQQPQQPSIPNSRIGLQSANGQRPQGGIPSRLQRPSSSSSTGSQPQAAAASGPPSSATFRRGSPGKVGGARPISGAFTLDLEKIESTVENMGEGGVRLVNHNLDEIFNDGPVRLPQTMTARRQFSPPSAQSPISVPAAQSPISA